MTFLARTTSTMVLAAAFASGCAVETEDAVRAEQSLGSDVQLRSFEGTYRSKNAFNGDCGGGFLGKGRAYGFVGYEPADAGTHPVFLYTVGTELGKNGTGYDSHEVALILKEMARRGFVAVSVAYENGGVPLRCGELDMKASCIYKDAPNSAMRAVCSRTSADCEAKGVVVGGMSQGAMIALRSQNYYEGVRAAWALSVSNAAVGDACMAGTESGGTRRLSNARIWATNGADDSTPGTSLSTLQRITGWPRDGVTSREAADERGGYFQVQASDLQPGNKGGANHTFYRYADDLITTTDWDDRWAPPASTVWSLGARLDWLDTFVTH